MLNPERVCVASEEGTSKVGEWEAIGCPPLSSDDHGVSVGGIGRGQPGLENKH